MKLNIFKKLFTKKVSEKDAFDKKFNLFHRKLMKELEASLKDLSEDEREAVSSKLYSKLCGREIDLPTKFNPREANLFSKAKISWVNIVSKDSLAIESYFIGNASYYVKYRSWEMSQFEPEAKFMLILLFNDIMEVLQSVSHEQKRIEDDYWKELNDKSDSILSKTELEYI